MRGPMRSPAAARTFALPLTMAMTMALSRSAAGQDPRISTVPVAPGVYMLTGQGGNIGVSVGEDGAFLIDDQFAPMVAQIRAAVQKLTPAEVRFVINTHWHGDHTGGNERLGRAGAVIVAHENVRARMSVEQFQKAFNQKVPASPKAALPVITFTRDLTLHWNGDDVEVLHVPNAHTDGDAIVRFVKANVVHMGDVFFNGSYPYIDTGGGGSLAGTLAAVDRTLGLIDGQTKVIPGHGPLGDRAALQRYRDVLQAAHDRVAELLRKG